MRIEITAVVVRGPQCHERVSAVRWRDPAGGGSGEMTVEDLVVWLQHEDAVALAGGGAPVVAAHDPRSRRTLVRACPHGSLDDDLLALPRFDVADRPAR